MGADVKWRACVLILAACPIRRGKLTCLDAVFPHLYAQLEGENVESVKDLVKPEGEKGWDAALERARQEGWLQD